MDERTSFDQFVDRLRCRDDRAAADVFRRFSQRLIALARTRLDERVRGKVDPEDVLQSVCRSFFARQLDGQFELVNWENLWSLLTLITIRKCANQNHHYRAECRDVAREVALPISEIAAFTEGFGRDPEPAEAVALTETIERLLRDLPERDREIITLHLQGDSIAEISAKVDWAERTVHRCLDRVRKKLRRQIDS